MKSLQWATFGIVGCGVSELKVTEDYDELPSAASHVWQSYRFGDVDDDVACSGLILKILVKKTHFIEFYGIMQ